MAKLVLLRHGQSLFNEQGRFTGWMDIDLSERGKAEAAQAGWLMRCHGLSFDIAFSSSLKRAIRTMWIVLDEMDLMWTPALPCWRLNERFYGELQGKSIDEAEKVYGAEQVKKWRRGYNERPPAVTVDDDRYPGHDMRYKDVEDRFLPRAESLQDTEERIVPFWKALILPEIRKGRNVLVVSHGNCIRALVRYLDDTSEEEIEEVEIGTARPLIYDLQMVDADGEKKMSISDHYYLSSGNGGSSAGVKAGVKKRMERVQSRN